MGLYFKMYRQLTKTWIKMWKTNSEELKSRAVGWRKELSVHRINKPSRIESSKKIRVQSQAGYYNY